jgi:hypothetical protein
MALTLIVGNIVAMSVSTTALPYGTNGVFGPVVQQQPPRFGVVDAGAGGPPLTSVSVLWWNGLLATAIPVPASNGVLDKIGAPSSGEVTRLQGFFVAKLGTSGEYQGTVVMLYTRDNSGTPSATLALIRTNVGTYLELPAADLTVVTGR